MNAGAPSLNALRTFETTVRYRSMTKAAEELHVTHGAVSRQIKALETTMGVTLLKRGPRSLEPTPEGARLAEGLTAAFGTVYATLDRVRPGPLTLSCSSSITMCWLIPRVSVFYRHNPGLELKLDLNYDKVDFARDNISVAIRNSTIEPPRSAVIRELGTEWIGPVCSPDYAQANKLKRPADLTRATLLSTRTRTSAWADWLTASGCKHTPSAAHEAFDHFYLVLQAAACGLGIAVLPHMLAINELKSRRLVAPFGFVPGPRQISLWIAPHASGQADVRALEDWLLNEMRHSAS
ncbi:MAG: LysR family transcriptional regulator [Acetobacteraceae bacterium]|nr:LysR family transcriptional regulator [Acetobacteraceae bacterium]